MAESKPAGRWKDMHGAEVHAGDVICMPGVPFPVTAVTLVPCEEDCEHGAAAILDPETGKPDEVCLSAFEIVKRVAARAD